MSDFLLPSSTRSPSEQGPTGLCTMSDKLTPSNERASLNCRGAALPKAAIFFLLVALAGLSTLAKYAPYLPKTDPAHYVNPATKMKAAQSPAMFDQTPLHPVATVVPARPIYRPRHQDEPVAPSIQLIGLTVSIQHRSLPPPIS
jgi:hypothetical protein